MVTKTGYFDTRRDNELIAAGTHFWCHACLLARPLDDVSLDSRYCLGCYEFLSHEAELLPPKARKPDWIPQKAAKTTADVPQDVTQIMSTVEAKKIEVDIINPATPKATRKKRGPKFTELPEDLIRELAGRGQGSKAIVAKLKGEGITVSYKTIQRLLSGQRVMV